VAGPLDERLPPQRNSSFYVGEQPAVALNMQVMRTPAFYMLSADSHPEHTDAATNSG
jgi:hypothetical protein